VIHHVKRLLPVAAISLAVPGSLPAQQGLSRAEAVSAALNRGPRLAIALADTMAAAAHVIEARGYPDPELIANYSKDAPQYHVLLAWPMDIGGIRSTRIHAAASQREATLLRFQFDRASIAFDADTAYTQALAAQARARLSRRNAIDADSLRRIAEIRRDAGDASELEVQLALVFAGQQANAATNDSLALMVSLLDLQSLTGIPTDEVRIALSDTLGAPPGATLSASGAPLSVAAAEASAAAADNQLRLQRRLVWALPALEAGFETGDPSGDARGILPTFGFSLPLPLWNRNRGGILTAAAERDRARAELALARLEGAAHITRARREFDVAADRLRRDARLLESANRVVAMSIRAYQEGASPLASVLEGQRTSREVLLQYIDDLAAAWNAAAALRLHTLTPSAPQ
jgi:cobalt-zinc-cadmium efflux system outer membrane protein